ncbi:MULTISPECIES: hypothetical protein [Halorussus]|uniref:DUF7094 domain-containing protein n=1 Tax=Halorussus TaxID=1070314 RepID=UPI000E212E6A|nr:MULTISPECIES: hypothetical protein [Halorussus]NHN60839.1 hypothetical protein [Halorussus sp. JP-T4]
MRFIPVMLALLLALSPGAVAVQASAPTGSAAQPSAVAPTADAAQSADDRNTTNVMTLGTAPARTAFDAPSLALGSSLAMDRGEFRAELGVKALDRQLRAANSTEEKKQILNRYRYRIENRIISLKAAEQQATQAFSNGTISKSEYLRTLGAIDSEVTDVKRLITAMQARASAVPRFGMQTEANTLKGKLVTVEGPIRDRISATMRGEQSPARVYVATAENGVVLSTIVNGEYVREIVRTDRRNPASSKDSSMTAARQSVIAQYPWTYNHSSFTGADSRYGTTNIYQITFQHDQGELVVYYDGGTESVFREIQYKRLTGQTPLPTGPAVSNTSENVTLTVNRTFAGGPLRVRLTNATGAPIQGEITVAGDAVGRTGSDGVLWTLGPAEQFRVSATHDFTTVNVTAAPVEAP